MDIAEGTLTLRPNSSTFSPKPDHQDLALLTTHLQERYSLSSLRGGLLYRAVIGAAIADLMRRSTPTAPPLAEQLLRQTIDVARLAWIVDRAGGRAQVSVSQPLLASQGVWYGPAEQVLNQRDLSSFSHTHSTAHMEAQYTLHSSPDGYWDGLEACLYTAPVPVILPAHLRFLVTSVRSPFHAPPTLWDAQIPAGQYCAAAVHLSHPDAAISEVVLVLDLPRSVAQRAMGRSGALRTMTYLTRTTAWQVGWQSTQLVHPDGTAENAPMFTRQSQLVGQWTPEEAKYLAMALAAVPRDQLPCTHRTEQHWPVAYYPLHPARPPHTGDPETQIPVT